MADSMMENINEVVINFTLDKELSRKTMEGREYFI